MDQNFGTPVEQPKKNNTTLIIIIVAVVLVLCCCCIAAGIGINLLWPTIQQSLNGYGYSSFLSLL